MNSITFREYLNQRGVKIIDSSFVIGLKSKNKLNGTDLKTTFGEVYNKYVNIHLPTISESSRHTKLKRCNKFLPPLFDIKMINFNPYLISEFINYSKEYKVKESDRKFNHDKQLKGLSSIFNFWSDHFDYRFINPMKRHHYKLGIIKEIKEKNRQISIEEFHQFILHLNPFFKKFAMIQWFMAGRVGEVAGIQKHRINFNDKVLTIKEVLIWIKGAPKVKDCPKNGEQRQVFINDRMAEIFVDLIRDLPDSCPFLFHKNGNPLRYNMINEHYMRAWKKSGLYPKYSGTHIVRYCSAIHARKISGSLDAARAVTGHKSIKMAEKYACFQDNELNKKTLQDMQEVFSA